MSERANDLQWKKAICGICPAGCWVEVGMDNGRLADIRPDRGHPLGLICRRGQHAPEIVYSEHRVRTPLRRTGPKGTLEFEPISWDQAFDLIVENLERIKRESGPEAVSIYTGRGAFELSLCDMFQPAGVAVSSASSVLFPFGSPNTMGVGALCYVSFAMIAPHVTMGRMLVNMFTDMEWTWPAWRPRRSAAPRSSSSIRGAPTPSPAPAPSGFPSAPERMAPSR
jgi:anaerobic selenocysteine-containing dehydrogenase